MYREMAILRNPAAARAAPGEGGPVAVFARDYPSRHRIAAHAHPTAQLLHAASGLMRVTTAAGRWQVPTQRAVWIPAGIEHVVDMEGLVSMRSLYFPPERVPGLPGPCAVLKVRPFLRALIDEAVTGSFRAAGDPRWAWISALVLEELATAAVEPLFVPMPRDGQLLAVCAALLEDPGSDRPLEQWADRAGTSPRTLARRFHGEVGMGFRAWREQARLAEAVSRLNAGAPVGLVAADLGYRSPSAFIAMFRRNLGCSPGAYR